MSYKVTAGKTVLASSEEFASFDMLTGQYVTLASVASDWEGLQNALKDKLAKNARFGQEGVRITDLYVGHSSPAHRRQRSRSTECMAERGSIRPAT